jgi:tRNA threonylcarbamoyl adenosine modification protein YeaZ
MSFEQGSLSKKVSNILFIDTSQSYLVLGLKTEHGLFETIKAHNNSLGSILAEEIKLLFDKAHLSFKDLHKIIVGAGPGSYTGTRVGVAFAESLGYGLCIPVVRISSLLFFMKQGASQTFLKSKFKTVGVVTIQDHFWSYNERPYNESSDTFSPLVLPPQPDWQLLADLQAQKELKELIYFSIS